ncbi:MAG: peptide ABC transporter substrate-binding protein [Candidatus Taylorbacteria bacterium]|nr:peptide ABC transporter substrate-binding protein [Candidatus Taylorbacteria bacterium]
MIVLSGLYILDALNKKYSVEMPMSGGTYTEGIVGYARFINPVLAFSDADKDLITLIYSGLLKASPEGKLVSDLAESWNVSEDGLTYTVTLKPNLVFHDNSPLTTDDIEFTIEKMRDQNIKSPKADIWNGVKVEKVNEREIKFILKKSYAPFLENLTFGVLPKHVWKDIEPQAFDVHILNREPIGSGPYKIKKVDVDTSGIYQSYRLESFEKYALKTPYIDQVIITFFKNEADALSAYKSGNIDAIGGISPEAATELKEDGYTVTATSLPRVFALFLNQSSAPVLTNKEVRKALNESVDRNHLINEVLKGWGSPEQGPIPEDLYNEPILSDASAATAQQAQRIQDTQKQLLDKGWKLGADNVLVKETKSGKKTETVRLSFSISTSNIPELKKTAEILKDTWTKLGADVTVQIFEPSDLTQKVIRPRKYDSLLFGNVIGRDLDLYPFWHSSERNDPGLNIALYTNIKADKALDTLRTASDESKRKEAFDVFNAEVANDIPAIFLYSPGYIYATSDSVKNIQLQNMTSISERFMNIDKWYIHTERIWKIFVQN